MNVLVLNVQPLVEKNSRSNHRESKPILIIFFTEFSATFMKQDYLPKVVTHILIKTKIQKKYVLYDFLLIQMAAKWYKWHNAGISPNIMRLEAYSLFPSLYTVMNESNDQLIWHF